MDKLLTIPKLAKLLGVAETRVRHALTKLDEQPPRAGRVSVVPADWIPAIRHALTTDLRKPAKPKAPRVRLRLH